MLFPYLESSVQKSVRLSKKKKEKKKEKKKKNKKQQQQQQQQRKKNTWQSYLENYKWSYLGQAITSKHSLSKDRKKKRRGGETIPRHNSPVTINDIQSTLRYLDFA